MGEPLEISRHFRCNNFVYVRGSVIFNQIHNPEKILRDDDENLAIKHHTEKIIKIGCASSCDNNNILRQGKIATNGKRRNRYTLFSTWLVWFIAFLGNYRPDISLYLFCFLFIWIPWRITCNYQLYRVRENKRRKKKIRCKHHFKKNRNKSSLLFSFFIFFDRKVSGHQASKRSYKLFTSHICQSQFSRNHFWKKVKECDHSNERL